MDQSERPTMTARIFPRRNVLMIVAVTLQVIVIWYAFTGGHGITNWHYTLAVLQAPVGLMAVVWVARRRPLAALAVPLVSLLLTEGIRAVENWAMRA